MSTYALVGPLPPREDAGRGLTWKRGWLVSSPSARHVRWLAPWIQAVISDAWNAPLSALRIPAVRSYIGLTVVTLMVCSQAMTATPQHPWGYLDLFVGFLCAVWPPVYRWCDGMEAVR